MGNESRREKAQVLFDEFVSASTCRAALHSFRQLCEHLHLDLDADRRGNEHPLYRAIRRRLAYWKANALWSKLERRASRQEYLQNRACRDATCAVIGAGPCGLRAAVELSFLGARVVVLEKRDTFSRNNVLHLWPFAIHDLRGLGAKKFYGKFCAGSIDHISIRQLQLVLLKVALLLGVEVHVNVEFKDVLEPPGDQRPGGETNSQPVRALVSRGFCVPDSVRRRQSGGLPVSFQGWAGRWRHGQSPTQSMGCSLTSSWERTVAGTLCPPRPVPAGFRRKEFRGKLAIAITANFKNRNTRAEARVQEIGGVASIFNQRFFQDLRQQTGVDLENLVYYKDDTHYFVMTAKKRSLLHKGVILQDFADTQLLLSRSNVDHKALQAFARTAADFSTDGQLPSLDFAINHYGRPDVAMFDFTSMYASENAAMVRRRRGHRLLVTLVGDSLLEPFWPMGTGVARGFLAALDASWMIRRWCQGDFPLDLLAERESLYRFLAQTTPENMQKNFSLYSLDPSSRYVNICLSVTPDQVRHLLDTEENAGQEPEMVAASLPIPESLSESNRLLAWCRLQTAGYPGVAVSDLTASWKSGLALCALLHRHRPQLIDFESLNPAAHHHNVGLAFDVCERELGISPLMTVEEMTSAAEPDALSMVMYLSQLYQLLREGPLSSGAIGEESERRQSHFAASPLRPSTVWPSQDSQVRAASVTPASLLSRLGLDLPRQQMSKEKRSRPSQRCHRDQQRWHADEAIAEAPGPRVRLMARLLQAKLGHGSSSSSSFLGQRTLGSEQEADSLPVADRQHPMACASDVCFFCRQKVYVMERLSAEGLFFHRSCFACHVCRSTLRIAAYRFHAATGKFSCPRQCEPSACTGASAPKPDRMVSCDRTQRPSCTSMLLSSEESSVATEHRRLSAFSLTPERIELENDKAERLEAEEISEEEISEEFLACFNLSTDDQTLSSEADTPVSPTYQTAWEEALEDGLQLTGCQEEEDREEDQPVSDEESSDDTGTAGPGETPVWRNTPSTASFVTTADSAASVRWPSPSEKEVPLVECVEGAWPEESNGRCQRVERPAEGGGARALWKAVFSRTGDKTKEAGRPAEPLLHHMHDAGWWTAQRKCSPGARNNLHLETLDMAARLEKLCIRERDAAAAEHGVRAHLQPVSHADGFARPQPAYVPHALAFRPAFPKERRPRRHPPPDSDGRSSCATEVAGVLVRPREPSSLSVPESLFRPYEAPRPTERRRPERSGCRRAKRRQLERLRRAQLIQWQLQLVEEEQRRLEAQGVALEQSLRGVRYQLHFIFFFLCSLSNQLHFGELNMRAHSASQCDVCQSELPAGQKTLAHKRRQRRLSRGKNTKHDVVCVRMWCAQERAVTTRAASCSFGSNWSSRRTPWPDTSRSSAFTRGNCSWKTNRADSSRSFASG
ncbi:protein-methionine sulfoxide oxidase mical3a-like isoform X3 [Syngnathus typhle]|uniref:protein-methionine sulfoxide oxidase mical3a-like isoform X3 n=1 Tax=Syngnathus typhle TaxID=161592 RepID=UPI002A69B478|nr:protein-methionine sulfoxide oxidase mical3a-like isoform X3 [Syngnathus typhle]